MLVKSISGIRGTIGGRVGEGLNPVDIVRFSAAYATQRRQALLCICGCSLQTLLQK